MAFIEPRLIHLLNGSTTTPEPESGHDTQEEQDVQIAQNARNTELPSIKDLPYPQTSSRPLPPIETAASHRPNSLDANGGSAAPQYLSSLYTITDDNNSYSSSSLRREALPDRSYSNNDLRMILEDTSAENADDGSTKKRSVKEDFPQLPQPLKKKQATASMFPPIIPGLFAPPSNAALFPPISSASFEARPPPDPPQPHSITNPFEAQPFEETAGPSSPQDSKRTPTGKVKRRAAKPRRKWSDAETNDLMRGVCKHGIGRWTDILEDPEYRFNERSAGDLKDRFRTCVPEEFRGGTGAKVQSTKVPYQRPRKGIMSENILNDVEEELDYGRNSESTSKQSKQRKSRAHRKKMEDLVELGIQGPFKKSQRRERRPFSEQDDREILEGYEVYGPHWTKIQRDPRFNLQTRQPTDLRDRLRNKYPEKFIGTEKTTMQIRNDVLEPSVNMDIQNSLNNAKPSRLDPLIDPRLDSQLNRTGSREDIPSWASSNHTMESGEQVQAHSGLQHWSEGASGGLTSGEMGISRLLLDDPQKMDEPDFSDRRGHG
ncbi:hypothetical protein F4808DRAFT_369234 [Astrocystis sublimbata]|nr:hypothetical protein F4808DRAFT_369234 [Astrocystis sublimbata]